MRKVLLLSATACLLLGFGFSARADDATRAILEKAVKAHGGIDKLTKLHKSAVQVKSKGKVNQAGGIDITLETSAQGGKSRQVIEGEVANTKFKQVVLFDGKKLRIFVNDKEFKVDDKKMVAEVKEQAYAEKVVGLLFFKEKGFKMEPLGEAKVNGKAALGIRVSSEGHRDVNLFFDKEKGLLVKTENQTIDFMSGEEKSQEKIFNDYKEMDGHLQPTKVVVLQGGKELMTLEIEEVKIVDKFDDDTFTKP
jgi:outer membrane lipoprotein-sorting protein